MKCHKKKNNDGGCQYTYQDEEYLIDQGFEIINPKLVEYEKKDKETNRG